MEGLTKEKAIELHRKMWTYIADESIKQRRCVTKHEAIGYLKAKSIIDKSYDPEYGCFACDYTLSLVSIIHRCELCPLEWNSSAVYCMCQYSSDADIVLHGGPDAPNIATGLFSLWYQAINDGDYVKASELAKLIANLPERKGDL